MSRNMGSSTLPVVAGFRGVARANDTDSGAYREPFFQMPPPAGVKKFALACPGKNKGKVCWSQRVVGPHATIVALLSSGRVGVDLSPSVCRGQSSGPAPISNGLFDS